MKNIIKIIYLGYLSSLIHSVPIVKEEPIDILLDGLAERHCRYCPSLKECIPPETYCREFDFPYNILYEESGIIIPEKSRHKKG